ncbi:MAG: PQQ-dependent sugar dehydrogenase [Anaerolineae bacterium]|nr:PQQ-dependent sugar dehydrogenase [Anaerolineae bacterium]
MFDNENDAQDFTWASGCIAIGVTMFVLALLGGLFGLWFLIAPATSTPGQAEVATAAPTPEPTAVAILSHDQPPASDAHEWTLFADGFDNPLYLTHAGDGSGRMFVVEQTGLIWVVESDGTTLNDPFLDISLMLPDKLFEGGYSEQGLLGLAFHPDYEHNGYFFINYTDKAGDTVISRYSVSADDPNVADEDSEELVLTFDQPFEDHNGGDMVFGPDGYLYISVGDGGNVNEFNARSQQPDLFLGKLLRINVDTLPYTVPEDNLYATDPTFLPEIWVLGLRNPWRFSFDRATNDLFIGDVGQWDWEEIDFLPAGTGVGSNFGWSSYEGMHRRPDTPPLDAYVTMPILEYPHSDGCSVTGGYVYRGAELPELNGYYFYSDYCNGKVWAAYSNAVGRWQSTLWMQTERQVTSFGEDEAGELYLIDYKGEILRLTRIGG